jgi:hypothetical protein
MPTPFRNVNAEHALTGLCASQLISYKATLLASPCTSFTNEHDHTHASQTLCAVVPQALPQSVPSAVDTFTPDEADQLQLPAAVASIKGHAAKMHASWSSCRPDAIGGADLSAYRWAHTVSMLWGLLSVVHGINAG